jgi:hypothetical protein
VSQCLLAAMNAIRHQILPASGVEFATHLHLTPTSKTENASTRHTFASRTAYNLVVARANLLRVFDVRIEPTPLPSLEAQSARERNATIKAGTEPLEGEVLMDEAGEGFLSVAAIKVLFSVVDATICICLCKYYVLLYMLCLDRRSSRHSEQTSPHPRAPVAWYCHRPRAGAYRRLAG